MEYTIRKITDIENYEGFNKVETAILKDNNIPIEKFKSLFSDLYTEPTDDPRQFLLGLSALEGTERFLQCLSNSKNEIIAVCGDYDTDGIMATVILRLALDYLGYKSFHIIPNRITDGCGLQKKHVDMAIKKGATMIITVDNGIISNDAIAYAKQNNLKCIITDHHLPAIEVDSEKKPELPNADIIIDPHFGKTEFQNICGATVILKLIAPLLLQLPSDDRLNNLLKQLIVFSGIATIGDQVDLVSENRQLVIQTLNLLAECQAECRYNRIGKMISAFLGYNYINPDCKVQLITEDAIAFYMASIINAHSRVYGDVNDMITKIINCEKDYKSRLTEFKAANTERKYRCRQVLSSLEPSNDIVDVIVLDRSKFDFPLDGLTGLLAQRLAADNNKPVFIGVKTSDGIYKFSGRSANQYSLYNAIQHIRQQYPELKINAGGHDNAVGLEISFEKDILKFKEYLANDYSTHNGCEDKPIVYEFSADVLDEAVYAHKHLAPFGIGFKRLTFTYSGIIKSKNFERNTLKIGDFTFKYYRNLDFDCPREGTKVEILFQMVDMDRFTEYKITNIEVIK